MNDEMRKISELLDNQRADKYPLEKYDSIGSPESAAWMATKKQAEARSTPSICSFRACSTHGFSRRHIRMPGSKA